MPAATRREARDRALALLYEADMKSVSPLEVLGALPVAPDPFAEALVRGVAANAGRIDEAIAGHAVDWSLERMAAVDRNILRLAAYELLERSDVPVGATISEAVELAKRYSTEESGRFVNGVLSALAAAAGRAGTPAGGPP